jgi:hypothetical protein
MPPITQGRRQLVVSHQTFMAWLRFRRKHPDAEIVEETDDGRLLVEAAGRRVEL